jgi:hypothetical protein
LAARPASLLSLAAVTRAPGSAQAAGALAPLPSAPVVLMTVWVVVPQQSVLVEAVRRSVARPVALTVWVQATPGELMAWL